MSEVTLRLPKTLHRNLEMLAEKEEVPLTQYIIYILSRQVPRSYTVQIVSEDDAAEQKGSFDHVLKSWGSISTAETNRILDERETVEPEADLSPELVNRLQDKIAQRRRNGRQ
jgi:predicted HicB family RNase H-like nuclease